jgi:starch synthase
MHVVMVSSEVAPFAKVGGLADVVAALPKFLKKRGTNVSVIIPYYRCIKQKNIPVKDYRLTIKIKITDDKYRYAGIFYTHLPSTKIRCYFIDMPYYFDRDGIYNKPDGDYEDQCERFASFCKAVIELIKVLKPDIVHCHDWLTALVPVYLKTTARQSLKNIKSILTIHNLAYMGLFSKHDISVIGLKEKESGLLKFHEGICLLKGGLLCSDRITVVSQRYAREIQTEEFGCGLQDILKQLSFKIVGITNGVDYSEWNPWTDRYIPSRYSLKTLHKKQNCKQYLCKRCGFEKFHFPVIGMVGRLTSQKGIDILVGAVERLAEEDVYFVILGEGEQIYHKMLENLQKRYPEKIFVKFGFDNSFAHQIYAGADMLVIPSRFEPCGLNQLYSMKYGTVPVVRYVGGLADTVKDARNNLRDATGFVFYRYSSQALYRCIKYAISCFYESKKWRTIVKNCMLQDWSWDKVSSRYAMLYHELL